MLLYHAIFAPFLAYGVSVWDLTYPWLLDSISAVQKKILMIVTFSEKTVHHHLFLIVCKFLSLVILSFCTLFLLYLNVYITLLKLIFRILFTSIQSIHDIGTRQSRKGDLFALRCNTTQYGLRSIHYTGVRL